MHNCSQSCSRYVERLPLMFIFGIATSPSTIQHMLPHSVSSLLCIELFQSLTCTQHLATVIDKVAAQPTHDFRVSNLRFFLFLLNVDFSSRHLFFMSPPFFSRPADPDVALPLQAQQEGDAGADEHFPLPRLLREELHQRRAGT